MFWWRFRRSRRPNEAPQAHLYGFSLVSGSFSQACPVILIGDVQTNAKMPLEVLMAAKLAFAEWAISGLSPACGCVSRCSGAEGLIHVHHCVYLVKC
jgi:hypothetical protein